MNVCTVLASTGAFALVVGLYIFVRKPKGSGGKTKLKLGNIEAELPVASLVPVVIGGGLLLAAANMDDTPTDPGTDNPPGGGAPVDIHPEKPRVATAACIPKANLEQATLKWGPSACPENPKATVRIDTCEEQRQLSWLKEHLDELRAAQIEGFKDLPSAYDLVLDDLNDKKDWVLRVRQSDGQEPFNVLVGYNLKSGTQDGCLSLSKAGKLLSASACMDIRGDWWVKREQQFCPVR
jgi:hypothetical protein